MQVKLSIILPIYNVCNYLNRCVQSILQQKFDNYELILVDDGSTDGSGDLCDKLAGTDKRIQVIHKKNGGLSSARNMGLEVATGEYVFWIDSDDWIREDAFAVIVAALKQYEPDILKFDYYRNMDSQIPVKNSMNSGLYDGNSKEELVQYIFQNVSAYGFSVWTHVYKRSFLKKAGLSFVSERKIGSEDFLFNYEAYIAARTINIIHECLYFYDLREGSLSQTYHKNTYLRFTELYKQLSEWLVEHDYFNKYQKYAAYFYVGRILGCISAEYKTYSDHQIEDGHENVKKILNAITFQEAVKSAYCLERIKKKKLLLYLCKHKCEKVIYWIFIRNKKY